MNVDKMRRYAHRNREAAQHKARQEWLANLEAGHRAFHDRYPGWPCETCLKASARAAGEQLARTLSAMRGIKPPA